MYYIFQAMRPERWQVLLLKILAGLHLPWQPRAPGTHLGWPSHPHPPASGSLASTALLSPRWPRAYAVSTTRHENTVSRTAKGLHTWLSTISDKHIVEHLRWAKCTTNFSS